MKFYYEGRLLRTSKNHHYTHALISEKGNLIGCSTSYAGADKLRSPWLALYRDGAKTTESQIRALTTGKRFYSRYDGRTEYREALTAKDTLEYLHQELDRYHSEMQRVASWPIVELTEEN